MPFLGKTPSQIVDPEVDIDGGSINGTTIGDSSASPATVTTFTSSGIDDNATSTAITIDAAENVGIGTSAPYNGLTVQTNGANLTDGIVLQASNATNQGSGISWNFTNSTNLAARIQANRGSNSGSAHTGLVFSTADSFSSGGVTERMRIDASGNVKLITENETAGTSKFLTFGTLNVNRAGIKCTNAATYNGSIEFYTGNSANFLERMRIDANGKLLVGATASIGGATASTVQITHTSAHNGLTIKNSGNARYYIHAIETATGNYAILNDVAVGVKIANGASAWSAFSDESLKENISDIGPVLDTIKDYQCVNYSLKATESETADKVGFIAQDWEHDFPNVVSKDDDGNLGMKYTETIPVLLKAIQEQQAMIEDLKAEVAALKAGDV